MIQETTETAEKRRKGTRAGVLMIVLGVLSSFVVYYLDRNSLDYFRMTSAGELAIIHAVLWSIVGVIVILWHNRQRHDPAQGNGRDPNDNWR